MKHNISNDKIVLEKHEYDTLIEHLTNMNNKINELMESFSLSNNTSIESENLYLKKELKETIKKLRADEILKQKQYQVLAYMIDNDYNSDMDVSKSAKVSYSSLSQWKKNDSCFKDMYKKILLIKG